MKNVFGLIALVGLALTLVPSILVFTGSMTNAMHKWLMTLGMLLWFGGAMGYRRPERNVGG
ncbi:MAG: hypothetical protein KDC57_13025 [Saprospiraceae bacterium]|nr:hypothetical protein [Saprospiraceae bacterium]